VAPPSVSRAAPWLVGNKCTDAMVFPDANQFKVKETLRGVGATTIDEVVATVTGTVPTHGNYLHVFFLD
jgi:hypothetical protein